MWAPCKESVVQINPHGDSNEWGLVSCRREAINSPGFWAGVISGDCSWTYWGAQIVSATGKATPPPPARGREAQRCGLPTHLVVMCGLQAPSASSWQGAGLHAPRGGPPAFLQLFIYSFSTLFCQYSRGRGFTAPTPLHNPLPFPRAGGQGKQKQLTSKGNLRGSGVDQSMVMGPGVGKAR